VTGRVGWSDSSIGGNGIEVYSYSIFLKTILCRTSCHSAQGINTRRWQLQNQAKTVSHFVPTLLPRDCNDLIFEFICSWGPAPRFTSPLCGCPFGPDVRVPRPLRWPKITDTDRTVMSAANVHGESLSGDQTFLGAQCVREQRLMWQVYSPEIHPHNRLLIVPPEHEGQEASRLIHSRLCLCFNSRNGLLEGCCRARAAAMWLLFANGVLQ